MSGLNPETVKQVQGALHDTVANAVRSCERAMDICHSYVDSNNLPNARMSGEVALIGQAMGNLRTALAKIEREGLPTE